MGLCASHDSHVDRKRGRDRLPHPARLNALQLVQGSIERALDTRLVSRQGIDSIALDQATKCRFERVVVTSIPHHYFHSILLPFIEKHLDAVDAPEAPARDSDTLNELLLEF